MVQPDGMHPTFKGVKAIVLGITPAVKRAAKPLDAKILDRERLGEFGADLARRRPI